MDDYLKEAIGIGRAQASVRVMSEEEIIAFIQNIANRLRSLDVSEVDMPDAPTADMIAQGRKSIKENAIVCLECGKTMKVITSRHLSLHGMDAAQYKEKWGIKKRVPLACKSLVRDRRKKMQEMQLWEKRRTRRVLDGQEDLQEE